MGGVVLGVAGRTRGSSNSPPKLVKAMKLSMLPMKHSMLLTLAGGSGFAVFFGRAPIASNVPSIARFSGTEVREQSRLGGGMESL